MKTILCAIISFFCASSLPVEGTLSVVDVSSIQVQLANAKHALAEQVIHGTRQVEQIQKTVQQIQQLDNYLERFGDPKNVTLSTFNEAIGFLNELDLNKTSEEIVRDLKGEEIFRNTPHSPHKTITPNIELDGKVVEKRDTEIFTPEIAARRSLTHYREVRASALEQRKAIKKDIEASLQQLRTASTSSEVAKLSALLRSLESQLAANDREVELAASEVQTRFLENQIESQAQAKARMQRERASLRVGTEQDLQIYRLPSKPLYFKR